MRVITTDFETLYTKEYSLTKCTTEEYIRSPLFETIGVGVKVDDAPAKWFSGNHHQIKKFLEGFRLDEALVIAHNAMFDMAILNWIYDIRPKRIVDTLSMARAINGPDAGGSLHALAERYGLGKKGDEVIAALGKRRLDFSPEELAQYGEYCKNDVELTYKLFNRLMEEGLPIEELRLIDLTIRMFSEPVLSLDAPLLTEDYCKIEDDKARLLESCGVTREDLMSNAKFADLLRKFGVEPPTKISAATQRETWAFSKTDEEFLALKDHENPDVQTLVAARLGTKSTLEQTRTARFMGIARRGKLPVPLAYYKAHTGRYAATDGINLQNLPRKSMLKKSILPPDGYLIADADSSQVEARMLAWLSGQDDLVQEFDQGVDVYKSMAMELFGKAREDIEEGERFLGKTVILGAGYGTGWAKFQKTVKVSANSVTLDDAEAQRIINTYRATYPYIPRFWKMCDKAIVAMVNDQYFAFGPNGVLQVEGRKGIRLPNGLYLKYHNIRPDSTGNGYVYDMKKGRTTITTKIYGAKLTENVTQALARIAVMNQLLKIAKRYRVALTVHDSVVALVEALEKEVAKVYIENCMKARPSWAPDLPLTGEVKISSTYGG